MRQFSKANRVKFEVGARQLFDRLGFLPFPEDEPGYSRNEDHLRIMTDHGWFHVNIPTADFTLSWYDITGRFDDPKGAFGEFYVNSLAVLRARELDISLPSGTWNISGGIGSDDASTRKWVFDRFEDRMEHVNARPPTDEEEAVWQAAYAEESAKLKIQRADYMVAGGSTILRV